jgi:hypothetical protein
MTPVQKNPTECGVSEGDYEASPMRRPWPTRGLSSHGRGQGGWGGEFPHRVAEGFVWSGNSGTNKTHWYFEGRPYMLKLKAHCKVYPVHIQQRNPDYVNSPHNENIG